LTTLRRVPEPTTLRVGADLTEPMATALGASQVEVAPAVLPSSRRVVELPVYIRHETLWADATPGERPAASSTRIFSLDGTPLAPELLVVRLLERAGWGAAWRRTWNGVAYWRDVKERVEPGPLALSIVEQVTRQAGYEGSWDIVAWRGRELRLFASRAAEGQRISAFMADWLDAALRMGVPLGCFAVVEHHVPRPKPARRR
jgi:hypothetical protein